VIASATSCLCALGLSALCLGAPAAVAQEDAGTKDAAPAQAVHITLEVGEVLSLGPGKLAPIRCDEPDVVEAIFTDSGLGLRGLKPGSTPCSVYSATGLYVRYQVRVVVPPPSPGRRKKK
jgi:hypothetical protein